MLAPLLAIAALALHGVHPGARADNASPIALGGAGRSGRGGGVGRGVGGGAGRSSGGGLLRKHWEPAPGIPTRLGKVRGGIISWKQRRKERHEAELAVAAAEQLPGLGRPKTHTEWLLYKVHLPSSFARLLH